MRKALTLDLNTENTLVSKQVSKQDKKLANLSFNRQLAYLENLPSLVTDNWLNKESFL